MGESPKTGLGFPNLEAIAQAYKIRYEGNGEDLEGRRINSYPLEEMVHQTLKGKDPVLCEIKTPRWEKSQGRLDSLMDMKLETY